MSRVVVIGAGLAGLAAACHLTGRGFDVTVVERESVPGGRAGQLSRDGFTFDTGPTVLTMRNLVADALAAVEADIDTCLPMRRLDPAYRARFDDGSTIHIRHGRAAMRQEIAGTCGPADAAAFDGFVDWLTELYEIEVPHFIARNFDSPLDLLANPLAAAKLIKLGGFGKLGAAVRRRFDDPRLHRLFSFQAMYAGLAPDEALAIYAVITYMDSIEGVWFPDGGMHALPTAMAAAVEKAGATLRYGDHRHRDPAPVRQRRRGRGGARRRRPGDGRRRGLHPGPTGRVRAAVARSAAATSGAARGSTPPRRWSGTSGSAAYPSRRSATTTSTSAASGRRRSTLCSSAAS